MHGVTAKSVWGKRALMAQTELPPAAADVAPDPVVCARTRVCWEGLVERSGADLTAAVTEVADAVRKFSFQLLLSIE